MGSINNFQALMKSSGGFARLARYEIVLHAPAGVSAEYSKDVSLLCDSISMPGHDLQTSTAKFGTAVATEMVTGHGYEGTIESTFYLDRSLNLKDYFDNWQELAISTEDNTVQYYKGPDGTFNYVGSMDIYQISSIPITETTYDYPQSEIEGSRYKDAPVDRFGHELPITKTQKHTHETIRTYGIHVEKVYPSTIGAIEYAYATSNELARLTVGFQYRKWKAID